MWLSRTQLISDVINLVHVESHRSKFELVVQL